MYVCMYVCIYSIIYLFFFFGLVVLGLGKDKYTEGSPPSRTIYQGDIAGEVSRTIHQGKFPLKPSKQYCITNDLQNREGCFDQSRRRI